MGERTWVWLNFGEAVAEMLQLEPARLWMQLVVVWDGVLSGSVCLLARVEQEELTGHCHHQMLYQ